MHKHDKTLRDRPRNHRTSRETNRLGECSRHSVYTKWRPRIYLDPRPLNKAIKRQHHRLPTAEIIISEMAGAQYFSKLDASSGYWQVRVNDDSYDLPNFGTPFGRYRFKRLPFRIHSASEVFQAKVASLIGNLPGYSQDDIRELKIDNAASSKTRC